MSLEFKGGARRLKGLEDLTVSVFFPGLAHVLYQSHRSVGLGRNCFAFRINRASRERMEAWPLLRVHRK